MVGVSTFKEDHAGLAKAINGAILNVLIILFHLEICLFIHFIHLLNICLYVITCQK